MELYKWTDTYSSDNSFIRELGKNTYYYKDGKLILSKSVREFPKISTITGAKLINEKIITMNLECVRDKEGNHTPYLLCWYSAKEKRSYFISDYNNFNELLQQAMSELCVFKYKGYKIYMHNFTYYDGILLMKELSKFGECRPLMLDEINAMGLDFKMYNGKGISITFKDSLKIIPSSLKDACKAFSIDTPKLLFPVLLDDINYSGPVPEIKYFPNISIEEYNKYVESFQGKTWNFKEQSIQYCMVDCIALFKILKAYNELTFEKLM